MVVVVIIINVLIIVAIVDVIVATAIILPIITAPSRGRPSSRPGGPRGCGARSPRRRERRPSTGKRSVRRCFCPSSLRNLPYI